MLVFMCEKGMPLYCDTHSLLNKKCRGKKNPVDILSMM